ncbi:MAG: Na(+)/H(+) antiporter subunit D [Rhodospirillaceae bacterium]|nr:Na(+)/H(+) antiporter subunit D [Rhodospirillaceae bacterium]
MTADIHPGLLLLLGGLATPLLPRIARRIYVIALPLVGLWIAWHLDNGNHWALAAFGFELELFRVDRLATIFSTIFLIAAALGNLYAYADDDRLQATAAQVYAGAAISATYTGDLVSLFLFWELTAVASVFLIWARKTERAYRAGLRYLVVQVGSGVLLLCGLAIRAQATGSVAFGPIGLDGAGGVLIFLAFGIKCAFPFLHNWLQDAYPEATVSGAVILSAFTTKLAVYALARGFAGTEMLIWIGAAMAAFPIFYAVIENDLRRVLSYSLNNQLGFMVVGIGIGTELALNGTAAHAFTDILFKALLFMSMGAVLYRTGTANGTDLGGLYKTMPWTAGCCIVGAASISGFPLFSGFISKSMIIAAAAEGHHWIVWSVLLFASAGVFHHSGIKIPYFAFFAHDSGKRPPEAPWSMRTAMGITAALCIAIGIWPAPLYAILPYPVVFDPYTTAHVVNQLQLLLFSALAFTWLMRTGLYPPEMHAVNLDADVIYRRFIPRLTKAFIATFGPLDRTARRALVQSSQNFIVTIERIYGPTALGRTASVSQMVSWIVGLLAIYLALEFLSQP